MACSRLRSATGKGISSCASMSPNADAVALSANFTFFFFQAEDGIRDWSVTGVQTCALPIYPRSLDPALSTDVPTGEMVTLLFDGLTQFDPDGRLLPGLSDRWTTDRKGQRYVFHLRPGVSFHDGRPLVAADVQRSFLRVLNPATHGGRVWPLLPITGAGDFADGRARDVRGMEVLGDTAIAFVLTEPLAIFPKFLAMPVAAGVPSALTPAFSQLTLG